MGVGLNKEDLYMKRPSWLGALLLCFFSLLVTVTGASTGAGSELTSDEALSKLKEGNRRFVTGSPEYPHSSIERRNELVGGQHPFVTIIGCSDSRVPVEWVFDAGLGDLFVIRVAGNVSDTDEIASIEYGAEHLNTPLIVVLGHRYCGAVTAVVGQGELEGNLLGLLDNIFPAAEKAKLIMGKSASQAELVEQTVRENVYQSIDDLLSHSPGVAHLVETGEALVVGAVYDLESGEVEWLGKHPNQSTILRNRIEAKVNLEEQTQGAKKKEIVLAALVPLVLAPTLGSMIIYVLFIILFIGENRMFGSLKIFGRLAASFFAIIVVLGGVYLYSLLIPAGWLEGMNPSLAFWSALLITLIFSLFYASGHVKAFRKFFKKLSDKKQVQNQES